MRNSLRGDLIQQLRRPSDFYRGHLAEDYDGIGQYILVSMSRGSTAAALRARIAAGDFGGDRLFPVGTPVVMHSHHGQLEVLSLGNLPISGCSCQETFTRTESNGLGTGDLGSWQITYGNPTYFLVNGLAAEITLADVVSAYVDLPSTPTLPIEILFKAQARSDRGVFAGWSSSNNVTYDNFHFTSELIHSSFSGTSLISIFLTDLYPNSIIDYGLTDNRSTIAPFNLDAGTATLPWPADLQTVSFNFRFLLDSHGVYGRFWLDGEEEVTDYVPGFNVLPFALDPNPAPADWLATGKGKSQAWSVYRANMGGYSAKDLIQFQFGSDGVSNGINTKLVVDNICIVQSGWC